jgi:hypothetical protein
LTSLSYVTASEFQHRIKEPEYLQAFGENLVKKSSATNFFHYSFRADYPLKDVKPSLPADLNICYGRDRDSYQRLEANLPVVLAIGSRYATGNATHRNGMAWSPYGRGAQQARKAAIRYPHGVVEILPQAFHERDMA